MQKEINSWVARKVVKLTPKVCRVAQCVPGGGYGAAIGFIFGGGGRGCKVIIRTADCEP
jgi:hypothetical protein